MLTTHDRTVTTRREAAAIANTGGGLDAANGYLRAFQLLPARRSLAAACPWTSSPASGGSTATTASPRVSGAAGAPATAVHPELMPEALRRTPARERRRSEAHGH